MPRYSEFDREALTAILARQYQVITRSQVLASGMADSALDHRLRAGGPWQRLLPGVFLAVTGSPTREQRDIAALLYAGPESILTGAAALRLWGVRAPYTSTIDVLIPESKQRKSAGFVRIRPTEVIAAIRTALANANIHPTLPIRTVSAAAVPPPRPAGNVVKPGVHHNRTR
jgi:hypothetical protein